MCNKSILSLNWDSEFFKKKTGQIFANEIINLENVLSEAKKENYQLIYVFGDKNFIISPNVLKQFNGLLADRKILFEKKINTFVEQDEFVSEYTGKKLLPELEQLAYDSGQYSRFKLDKNFSENDFYRMYKIWIDNSINHKNADNVFVVVENKKIKGMVTLKIDDEKGQIGLIAISPDTQGRGYGKKLIKACENVLLNKSIDKIEVYTQINNIQACAFYEKCGFHIKNITNIYHFWL